MVKVALVIATYSVLARRSFIYLWHIASYYYYIFGIYFNCYSIQHQIGNLYSATVYSNTCVPTTHSTFHSLTFHFITLSLPFVQMCSELQFLLVFGLSIASSYSTTSLLMASWSWKCPQPTLKSTKDQRSKMISMGVVDSIHPPMRLCLLTIRNS